jgi:hypothetical protein
MTQFFSTAMCAAAAQQGWGVAIVGVEVQPVLRLNAAAPPGAGVS